MAKNSPWHTSVTDSGGTGSSIDFRFSHGLSGELADESPSHDLGFDVASFVKTGPLDLPAGHNVRADVVFPDIYSLANAQLNLGVSGGDAAPSVGVIGFSDDGLTGSPAYRNTADDLGPDVGSFVRTALVGATAGGGFQSDLIFIDFDSFAKGGQPGRGGGSGGGGSGSTTPNYVSGGAASNYNIEIIFKGTWDPSYVTVFTKAADLLSDYIQGDIPNVLYNGKVIDDLSITAELTSIDGVGGILGQAGPTAIRTGSYLPATGSMQFDIADATNYQGLNLFDDIVLHEMMHTLGFGSIWSYKGLLSGAGGSSPLFTGGQATDAYETLFGVANAAGVPVEQDGGSGTRDAHWDEETFQNELMTGYINASNDLSYMTVASLGDLGYSLDPGFNASNYVSPDWI